MSKNLVKVFSVLAIAMLVLAMTVAPVFAQVVTNYDQVKIESQQSETSEAASNITGIILGVVQVIGVAVAIIMLIVLAIKYISAAPNDKAEIKKHAVVYVVGAVVLFAASGIIGIIRGFAEKIPGSSGATTNTVTNTATEGEG